jgi:lysophospholipase L1-like esterase
VPSEEKRWGTLRKLVTASGVLALAGSVLIDFTRYGKPGSIGIGQILLALMGLLLVCGAVFGKRFARIWRDAAVVLLNTLVLLALIELAAIAGVRLGLFEFLTPVDMAEYDTLPYYQDQDWARRYWHEARLSESYRYAPFVTWEHLPFDGETINVDANGNRVTPDGDCFEEAFTLFTFGGSTMWGWGAPDSETIPAHLQEELKRLMDAPVCVVNYGEDGFVSTQGVIRLMQELQRGTVPDVVLFYDGINDLFAAYESGSPGAHTMLADVRKRFDAHPLRNWLEGTRTYWLITGLVYGRRDELPPGTRVGRLATGVAGMYLANYRIVQGLSREFGFESFFFWQPHLVVGGKPLSVEEERMRARMSGARVELAQAAHERIARAAEVSDGLWQMGDVFDEASEQIWIDEWGHVTPVGNRLIARAMAVAIDDRISRASRGTENRGSSGSPRQ